MKCSNCRHENPETAKFCLECGARFVLACTKCGSNLPVSAKFCLECGERVAPASTAEPARFASPDTYTPKHLAEKILNSRAALEGERKLVTVLFADLKGSMELLAGRDPEEARKILDAVLERMMEAVHHYEGTVNQVMGDGIMALFGAPLAHEDHAVRACYAALRLQDMIKDYAELARRDYGVAVHARVGLNSGEVVVRAIGSDLNFDYTAVGQTTHLAARMEQLADPGTILITLETLTLAEGFVEVKLLGPVPVKGLAEPVKVYALIGAGQARTRLQAAAHRGLTDFVGRDTELEQLRRLLQLAGGGRGQIAAIAGDAGVGKSRLVYELKHSHRLQGWLILESACVAYGKATSYLPLIELLKGYFKIENGDDQREIRTKVTRGVLALDQTLKSTLPALLAVLDVPVDDPTWLGLDPMDRKQCTHEALKRLLLREAREQPLLLIFEDLHWIDAESQALLDGLVESLGSARLLLLVNYRPEYKHGWGSRRAYSQIRLDTLPAESAGHLLDTLLGDEPGLEPLKQLLVKRGNPFFLEETIRALVETKALVGGRGSYRLIQPIHAVQVPATVQAILAARIDRLTPQDKSLLQAASVVGKDVPLALLQPIAELSEESLRRGLDHLQAAELLQETGLYPEIEYSFKHALTHEVTYNGILNDRRRELHGRIVTTIETLHPDRLLAEIERLAYHAFRSEFREKAVGYLRQAGAKATERSVLEDARLWLEQALKVLNALPESHISLEQGFEIRLEMRSVLTQLNEVRHVLEQLREAEALARRLSDDRRRGSACAFLTATHALLGQLDEGLVTFEHALEIAESLGDFKLRIVAMSYHEQLQYYGGYYDRAVELATENIATPLRDSVPHDGAPRSGSEVSSSPAPSSRALANYPPTERLLSAPPAVYNRVWIILSLAQLGRFAEATQHEADAIRIAERTQNSFSIGVAHRAAGTLYLVKGEWHKASALLEHAISEFQRKKIALMIPTAIACDAWALAQLGRRDEALSRLRKGEQLLQLQTDKGIVGDTAWAYHALGRAALLLRQPTDARRLADLAVKSSPRHPGFCAHAQHLLGDIATHHHRCDSEYAEGRYREALALAEPRGMRPLVAHCHLGIGRLYRTVGKRQEAHEYLSTAFTMYRKMEMRFWLKQTEAEMLKLEQVDIPP
jgi:class 3 adenylate cyclase/tetratricopeptide (TPR) repeat protein